MVISGKHTEKEVTITKASPAIKAMAGSLGGLMEACLLQPVDTIKTRMQLNPVLFPGIVSTGSSIVKTEGTKSLWKGLTPFATHLYLKYALRFGTNAGFQSLLMDKETGKLDAPRRVLAGLGAGVTEALVIVTPFEVIKIRLQNQMGTDKAMLKYHGPIDAVIKTVKNEGLLALWSGATPTVFRNGLNQASMFWFKNVVDEVLWHKREGDEKQLQIWQSMASGFLATCPGMVLTNPFDIAKTRLQVQEKNATGAAPKYRGLFQTMAVIAKEEGFKQLYRGLLPRILRVPPGMAITWGMTDQIVQMYERR